MKSLTSILAFSFVIAVGSVLAPSTQAQNLILNGSFELPGFGSGNTSGEQQYLAPSTAITDWTVSGSGDVYLHETPEVGQTANSTFNYAEDGSYYVDLSGSGIPHATIYQNFATIPTATYYLSFYIGAASWGFYDPAATINVQLTGGTSLLNTTLTPAAASVNINWTLETFSFVANSTSTRLSFVDTSSGDDNASFVDNVSVVPVPEPASGCLLLLGATIYLCRRQRQTSK